MVEQGKKAMLIDLDNTILPRDNPVLTKEVVAWFSELQAVGITICLVSNAWMGRAKPFARQLKIRYVDHGVKPLPFAFILGLIKCKAWPWQTVMVGDQVFTDVLGGTIMGMKTFMVPPLAKHDLTHTLMLRKLERFIIRDRKPISSL
jgi:HAD superfamily phosphatase (TIGR01668 family)